MMNKTITNIQIAWFFSNVYNGRFEDVSVCLKNKLGESRATQQLPIPNDAPSEIPRLTLSYPTFNLNVAKNRIDLLFRDMVAVKSIIPVINSVVAEELALPIGRVGFVKNFFVDGNTADLKKLLVTETVEKLDLKEISIRINEKKEILGYSCNSIESLSNGFLFERKSGNPEVKKDGLVVMRDLNTLAEEINKNSFKAQEIIDLVDAFDGESGRFALLR